MKLSGLQELMDLKKTIYEQVEMQLGGQPWHTSKAKQKKRLFLQTQYREGFVPSLHQTERLLHQGEEGYGI